MESAEDDEVLKEDWRRKRFVGLGKSKEGWF